MKIAISGVSGFIGMRLVEVLQEINVNIIALIRKESNTAYMQSMQNVEEKVVDFYNIQCISKAIEGVEVYIHLIGQMGGPKITTEQFEEGNCRLTENMLKACKKAGVKQFIYCSTPGVQGFGKRLCEETEKYAPRNEYEKTKVIAEKTVIKFCTEEDIKYTLIRPDFVYGPGDQRRIALYKNIQNKKFILTTSGDAYIHPTYIDDVVQGFIKAVKNPNAYNEIFNISAENDITVKEYLKTIAVHTKSRLIKINIGYPLSVLLAVITAFVIEKVFHKESFVSKNKIDFLALDHSTSNEKAKKLLEYQPEYTFHKGIEKTIRWYQKNNLL